MKRRIAAAALVLALGDADRIQAQSTALDSPQNSSAFEVASIKPADPSDNRTMIRFDPSGRFEANGVPLRLLMRVACDVQDFRIVGLPPWADSDRFIVEAKTVAAKAAEPKKANATSGNPSVMTDDEQKAFEANLHTRIRALLADCFSLRAHREMREMPVYPLVIANGEPKLKPAKDPEDGSPRRGLMGDRGRLTATAEPGATHALPVQDEPSLFTAVQEQLGLRPRATKAPVDVCGG